MKQVLVGTSGWSYDDWVGPFYPKVVARSNWIEHYADHFPTVEVNFTHYHLPTPDEIERITARMGKTYLTHVVYKAPQTITHQAIPKGDLGSAVKESMEFFEAVQPVAKAGLLAGLLYQFDHKLEPPACLDGLRVVLAADPPAPVFVEVRHAGFNEERYYELLRELVEPGGGAVVATDNPGATVTRPPPARVAYFRFHGRNEATWFLPDPEGVHGASRYDYLYPPSELEELAMRVRECPAERVLVYFNNHVDGKAPANALALMKLLSVAPPRRGRTLDDF